MNSTLNFLKARIYAFAIDIFFILLIGLVLYINFILALKLIFLNLDFNIQLLFLKFIVFFPSLIFFTISFFYFTIFYFLTNGKTFGKKIFQIKLLSKDQNLTFTKACIRSLTVNLTILLGSILFIVPFLRKDAKSLADLLAQTKHSRF